VRGAARGRLTIHPRHPRCAAANARAPLRAQSATPPQAGGELEGGGGGAVAYARELRRTDAEDGVGGGADDCQPALPPPLRANSSETKRKLEHSGAPAADDESDGERADGDHAFAAAAQPHGESKRARGSGSERALEPLLPSAKQPAADDAPPSDDRTKAIAAKVAARELEAAARKPAASKGMLGLSFSRKAKTDVPAVGPTPIAARTRLRGGMK
jgi:hypothetical protein